MFEFSKGDGKERDGYNMFQKEELGYLFIYLHVYYYWLGLCPAAD